MDPVAAIEALAKAGTAGLQEAMQHEGLKNSPEMIKAHILASQQAAIDDIRKTLSNEDLEAYRLAVAATPSQ